MTKSPWLELLAAVAAFIVFRLRMEYPWPLALLVATAIGALLYSTRRTIQNLTSLRHRESDRDAPDDPEP